MTLRVSERYMTTVMLRNLRQSSSQLARFQQMAASLRRLNSYADDPRAVGTISLYNSLISRNDQYVRNSSRSRAFVDGTDAALQDIVDSLGQARELAVREASAMGTPESHDRAVGVVESLIGRVLTSLNTTVEGDYIFGGQRTRQVPFVRSGDSVDYVGDTGGVTAQIGPHWDVVVNVAGSDLLGSDLATLHGTQDMALPLTGSTSLSALNLGGGWQPGEIDVQDGSGATIRINLHNAVTVNDVLAQVLGDSAGALTASITPDGRSLQLNGAGPLTITEVDGGTTAQSLGILGSVADDRLVGRDIRPAPSASTLLGDIPTLSGHLPLGAIVIEIGDQETTVDLSMAVTLQDLHDLVAAVLPELDVRIEGGQLAVVGQGNRAFTIRNAPGSTAAGDLGLSGSGSPARLLDVLFTLKSALTHHDPGAVGDTLTELEAVLQHVTGLLIRVGDTENVLDMADSHLQQRDERLQAGLSREQDADVAEVALELSKAEATYQSSLLASSRMLQMNLMQYLR